MTHPPDPRDEAARQHLNRRTFLKLAGTTGAAAALHPLAGRPRRATAQRPDAIEVLIEDIHLAAADLAGGQLQGATAGGRGITLAPGVGQGGYVSPVLTARRPFTHIGLHWTADPSGSLSFQVRSASDGGGWSPWTPALPEPHAPEGSAESFGALIGADHATRVQFRATLRRGGGEPLLSGATVTLLNATDGPAIVASSAHSATVGSNGVTVPVITRSGWGANEALRRSGGNEIWPRMYVPAKTAVVHHTATTNNYTDGAAEVRAIYTYHALTLGWGDIGYNALIDRAGNVYEGRHARGEGGEREILGPDVVAGHAAGHNYGSTGIALIGTFTQQGEGGRPGSAPPTAMWNALVNMVALEADRHHLAPHASRNFLRWNGEWTDGLRNISGHRDCTPTICPGGLIYSRLGELRDAVAGRLGRAAAPAIGAPGSAVKTLPLNEAKALTYEWGGSAPFLHLLEGWRRQANPASEDIDYLSGYDAAQYPNWRETQETGATLAELFEKFAPAGAAASPGRYTFHVRSADGSYAQSHTLLVTEATEDEDPEDPEEPEDPEGPGEPGGSTLTLSATGYKVRGLQKVDLAWSGGTPSASVEIRRDGGLLATVPSDGSGTGSYTDNIDARGGGSYTYRVVDVSTGTQSDPVTVTF